MAYFAYLAIAVIAIYLFSLKCKDSGVFARLMFGLVIGLLVGAGAINLRTLYLVNSIATERPEVVNVTRMVKDASSTRTEEPIKEDTVVRVFDEEPATYVSQKQVLRDTVTFDTKRDKPPQEPEIQNDS